MLILTRRDGQRIFIGEDIKITVWKDIKGRMKIGIEAPRDLTVLREELVTNDKKKVAKPIITFKKKQFKAAPY